MFISKSRIIAIVLATTAIFFFFMSNVLAKSICTEEINKENLNKWNIAIASDTKDLNLENTQEIKFKVQDSQNVAKGKIAPGVTALAKVEINLIRN